MIVEATNHHLNNLVKTNKKFTENDGIVKFLSLISGEVVFRAFLGKRDDISLLSEELQEIVSELGERTSDINHLQLKYELLFFKNN